MAQAAAEYKTWVLAQVAETIAATTTFTDAVRSGDVEGAKAAFAPSRQGWERIEPVAGLVEQIDGAVDARVDDFSGVDDPAFTGWHRLEYLCGKAIPPRAAPRLPTSSKPTCRSSRASSGGWTSHRRRWRSGRPS
ncbi:MAG TPA: EfeM/EfeO family lipoprotein [Acidimicrobiales bacterium]|nr:EfeM/EfeO family lipoprotein [Acidimicrobiales bacterium]